MEREVGDPKNPLLLSVRSGAAVRPKPTQGRACAMRTPLTVCLQPPNAHTLRITEYVWRKSAR